MDDGAELVKEDWNYGGGLGMMNGVEWVQQTG